jgi:hypothetical protein
VGPPTPGSPLSPLSPVGPVIPNSPLQNERHSYTLDAQRQSIVPRMFLRLACVRGGKEVAVLELNNLGLQSSKPF